MSLSETPPPRPVTIIRYVYHWHADEERGVKSPGRPHPALIMALAVVDEDGLTKVLALAITHSPPYSQDDALEVPAHVREAAGLDAFPQWVMISESNVFVWPGPDLRVIPDRQPETFVYGVMPRKFLRTIALAFKVRNRGGATSPKQVVRAGEPNR